MGLEKKELRRFLELDNGKRVELMPFDKLAEIIIKGSNNEKDKLDTLRERHKELTRQAEERCSETIQEALSYRSGYLDGLRAAFNECRIKDGEGSGR